MSKQDKIISLDKETKKKLTIQAVHKGLSLKAYIEELLIKQSNK